MAETGSQTGSAERDESNHGNQPMDPDELSDISWQAQRKRQLRECGIDPEQLDAEGEPHE